jgi:hypothetical protein
MIYQEMGAFVTSSNPSWISVFGPTILETGVPITTKTKLIFVEDHYDPEHLASFIDNRELTVVTEFFHYPPESSCFQTISYPIWLSNSETGFKKIRSSSQFNTTGCFNFMIYKARQLRLCSLHIIESYGLYTEYYTANVPQHLNFKHTPKVFGEKRQTTYNFINDYQNFLAQHVFDPTAVSLIIEPIELSWQDAMAYTEKSIYPILSCNFPIWLGGKRQAQGWKELGFDVFDDVIDHNYQHADTTDQRIRLAIELNLKILTDLNYAKEMRQICMPRFVANKEKLLNGTIKNYVTTVKESLPNNVYSIITEIEKCFT